MKFIRIGLCCLFVFTVLAYGSVEVWSQSILEISAGLLFLGWAVVVFRNSCTEISWSPLCYPLLGLIAIGLGQLVFRTTAYPYLTRLEILKLVAYFLVFFVSSQAFRARREINSIVWFLMIFCFCVSLFGIVQRFTSDGTIYWFQKLTVGGDPFGPYVNRNHFAGFVELIIPTGLALMIFRGVRRDMFSLAALFTVIPMVALIISGSRAGVACFVFQFVMLALMIRARRESQPPRFAALAVVALAAVALIGWLGASRAIERFSTLRPGDITVSRRYTMVRGAMKVFLSHPIVGSGLGAIVAVYPRYETYYDGRVVDHVHNDYFELLAESGVLGLLCGGAFLWAMFRRAGANFVADQGHFSRAYHAGASVGLAGLLLHSAVDFNLHIPSNALLFLLLSHLATSEPLPSSSGTLRSRHRNHGDDLSLMAEASK